MNAKENVRGQTAMWGRARKPSAVGLLSLPRRRYHRSSKVSAPMGRLASTATFGHCSRSGIYWLQALSPSVHDVAAFAARESRDAHLPPRRCEPSAAARPLVVAIKQSHRARAFLLDAGAALTRPTFAKRTPLYAAVEMRNADYTRDTPPPVPDAKDPMDLIKALLARGANPNARANTTPFRGFYQVSANWANFDGQTPFLRAALSGDVTLMRLLLEHGADPNLGTSDGATPLMAAAGINWVVAQTYSRSDAEYLDAAKLCLELGADVNAVNSQGFTAMHGAANRGFDAMVKLLADRGAKLDVKDKQGRTPMTFAEGVFLAVQPPVRKPSTIALIQQLAGKS